MRVSCQNGHERMPMEANSIKQMWECPACDERLTRGRVRWAIPPEFRSSPHPFMQYLHALAEQADFEIEVVAGERGRVTVEYPRPSHA